MIISLGILSATLLLALLLSVRGARSTGGTTSLEQWSVGNRGFGTVLVFMLLAGEIYTTFTFLGGSGWAYGRGAPAFYIIGYGAVAYIMSYWLLPAIWTRATTWRVLSQSEYFARAYNSPALGNLVALVSIASLMPYLVLQLKGLGIIVAESSYGAISATAAIWIGTTATVVYVVLSGVKGSAMTAALKDALVLITVVGLGIVLPYTLHGGIGPMFARIAAERPGFLTLPDVGMSPSWFASTVLVTVFGFYMWPHTFGSVFTARDASVFRRNAVLMPLYQLVLLFVFFIGLAALLSVPGLEGADADLALLRVTRAQFGPWIVGLVGAAGMLTALVPGSLILMSIATTLARIVRPRRDGDPPDSATWARVLVPVLAGVALLFTFRGGTTLVTLLLMAYSMVTQLFPPLLASLMPAARITASGAIAGILAGEAAVAANTIGGLSMPALLPQWPHAITDINTGFLALLLNVCTMLIVSRLTPPRTRPRTPRVG
ncbi:MAG: sodium:solute symporter family protein [Gemmatimonadota bacterium]|nr:sodium:solute symporter family protein [Gemmatimonadota bacterium]MDQ8168682.1 sodium:solute symporter family protein [Gemmatimonadota bacterium]